MLKTYLLGALEPYTLYTDKFTKEEFVDALIKGGRVSNTLQIVDGTFTKIIKKSFPDKKPRQAYISFLLSTTDKKFCNKCSTVKNKKDFGINNTNNDNLMSACLPCHNNQQSDYYYRNPEAQVARVRKRDRKLDRALTGEEIYVIFEKYKNKCVACGYTNEDHNIDYGQNLHLDHIIPFSKGGKTIVSNTQLLCRKCNSSKGDMLQ